METGLATISLRGGAREDSAVVLREGANRWCISGPGRWGLVSIGVMGVLFMRGDEGGDGNFVVGEEVEVTFADSSV